MPRDNPYEKYMIRENAGGKKRAHYEKKDEKNS